MPKIKSAIESLPALRVLRNARRQEGTIGAEELANTALRFPIIRSIQVKEEMVRFLEIVEQLKPRRTVEIGTCRVGTLFGICRLSAADATIISIDLPGGKFGGGYYWFTRPLFRMFTSGLQKLHLIRDDSHYARTLKKVRKILGSDALDLLFIDGDHTYGGARRDFEMYAPLVKNGGVAAFHDIVPHPPQVGCEVNRFWYEVKVKHRHLEIVKDSCQQWAGIGVLYV